MDISYKVLAAHALKVDPDSLLSCREYGNGSVSVVTAQGKKIHLSAETLNNAYLQITSKPRANRSRTRKP